MVAVLLMKIKSTPPRLGFGRGKKNLVTLTVYPSFFSPCCVGSFFFAGNYPNQRVVESKHSSLAAVLLRFSFAKQVY